MTADAKILRTALNKSRDSGLVGEERANSNTVRVLSDAVRESGDDRLADLWNSVATFLDVWKLHRRVIWNNPSALTYASDRSKFIALDYTDAGSGGASGSISGSPSCR